MVAASSSSEAGGSFDSPSTLALAMPGGGARFARSACCCDRENKKNNNERQTICLKLRKLSEKLSDVVNSGHFSPSVLRLRCETPILLSFFLSIRKASANTRTHRVTPANSSHYIVLLVEYKDIHTLPPTQQETPPRGGVRCCAAAQKTAPQKGVREEKRKKQRSSTFSLKKEKMFASPSASSSAFVVFSFLSTAPVLRNVINFLFSSNKFITHPPTHPPARQPRSRPGWFTLSVSVFFPLQKKRARHVNHFRLDSENL